MLYLVLLECLQRLLQAIKGKLKIWTGKDQYSTEMFTQPASWLHCLCKSDQQLPERKIRTSSKISSEVNILMRSVQWTALVTTIQYQRYGSVCKGNPSFESSGIGEACWMMNWTLGCVLLWKGEKWVFVTPNFDVGTYIRHKKIISRTFFTPLPRGTAIL